MSKFKRAIKLFIVTSVIAVLASACTNTPTPTPPKDDNGNSNENGESGNGNDTQTGNETMKEFMSLIKPKTTAGQLGLFIKDHIRQVDKTDADKMVEWLLIYQKDTIADFNNKILDDEYLNALNTDMGGVLDPDKIKDIENQEVQREYQGLVDGIMTVVRQEETPVVETDWKKLEEYSDNLTDDLSEVVKLQGKIQNHEYGTEKVDIAAITDDIFKTEGLLGRDRPTVVRWQGEDLYINQLYTLLVGPEGEYINRFFDKNSAEYKEVLEKANAYPKTRFARLVLDLDKIDIEDSMQVTDRIQRIRQFGLDSDDYIDTVRIEKENGEYNILNVHLKDKEKEKKINSMIQEDADKLIVSENITDEFNLAAYPSFVNKRYISYTGLLDHGEGAVNSMGFYRTLDYVDEEFVTLDEYLGKDTEEVKTKLEKITGREIENLPEFYINPDGVNLMWASAGGIDDYTLLTIKDLMEFLTLKEFLYGEK